MGTIVVGVDGSPGSDEALRWALGEGRLRKSTVRVVHAYQPPQLAPAETGVGIAGPASRAVFSEEELERLNAAADQEALGIIDSALDRARDVEDAPKVER